MIGLHLLYQYCLKVLLKLDINFLIKYYPTLDFYSIQNKTLYLW